MNYKQVSEKYGEIKDTLVNNIMKQVFKDTSQHNTDVLSELSCEHVYAYIIELELTHK